MQYPKDTPGANGTRTNYAYDDLFRLIGTTANTDTGLGLSAEYTYQNDYLTSIATPSTTYNFTYGNFGLRSAVKVGSQTLASYTYESGTNLLKTLAYGNGDSVQYTYDSQGRLTQQSYGGSDTVTYLYDNDGALSTVIDSASGSKTKYFYDFAGLLTKFTENRGSHARRVEYTYTEENQVSQKSEFAGSVRQNTYFRYDDFHRRTQVGTNSTWWKYTYDTLGRVATQRFTVSGADILTETFTYNNANQVTSIQKVTPENTRTHSYTYDDNGNIATVTVGNKTIRYTYDTAGQLIREDNPSTYLTTVWTYDRAGNILTEKDYAYTTGTPYELLGTNSYTYSDGEWKDLLIAYNGQSITYDQIGNPLTYNNGTAWTFTWEHGRQLATMSDGTTTWTNTYNSDGLRTSRTNGTTTYNYYYDGSQLTEVTGSNGNIWIFYDGNRPVIIKYGDTATYHYELNLQGDVIAILDTSGNRVVEYTYDAWGKILSISGSMKDTLGQANPLRYRGYVYDHETGLYYCQSRYYDPETGRFLNADALVTTGQGMLGNNMFAYCLNNPVMYCDPTGELTRGQIHDLVLEKIIEEQKNKGRNTLRMRETCIYYNRVDSHDGWGFCDLYDYVTGEVWELKRITCNKILAEVQLNRYTSGALKYHPSLVLGVGERLMPLGEKRSFTYIDKRGKYEITYWSGDNGIMWYDYTYTASNRHKRVNAAFAVGTTVVSCIAIGFLLIGTGGAAIPGAPAVIPFVSTVVEYFTAA